RRLKKLCTLRQTAHILKSFDLDYLYLIHFTKRLAELSAEEFIDTFLFRILNVGYLVIGEDARIGKGGAGDAKFILEYFERNGRSAEILALKDIDGKKIGSRAIREAVACGDLGRAEKLLGRPYALEGR